MQLIKNRVLSAALWSFLQRGGSLIIGFVANMVLARLLEPEDFGCLAIIMVFVTFADILIDSGLASALIQKKNVTEHDVSTVFSVNLCVSLVLFTSIFFAAPAIGRYLDIPMLALYLRVESIALIIRAFYCIQVASIRKNLRFKNLAKYNLLSSIISVTVAIIMAALGCGVWSLIAKNIVLHLSLLLMYRHDSKITYRFAFFKENFKELFGFGVFVAMSTLLESLYSNLTSFFIGKRYSVKDLGYYNQAHSLEHMPVYSMSTVITQVLFPFMSKMQDDKNRILNNTRRVLMATTFFSFPLLVYLFLFAKPVIILVYSAKWVPSVPYFQILCVGGLMNAIIHISRSVLKSVGETKYMFISQTVVTAVGLAGMFFISQHYDIKVLVVWIVCVSWINGLLLSFLAGRRIGYSLWMMFRDLIINFLFAIIAGCVSYQVGLLIANEIATAMLGALLFAALYFLLHFIFKTRQYNTVVTANK